MKYNIKINILYFPKSSSEINGNKWIEIGIYLLYQNETSWYQNKLTKSFFLVLSLFSSTDEKNIEFQ